MKRPELPEMVHIDIVVDDGWDWHDNAMWHHEEHKIPYDYLVYNGDKSYSTFSLTHSEAKRKKLVDDGWLSQDTLNRIEDVRVIEYEILKELENLKGRMNKYNFHPAI